MMDLQQAVESLKDYVRTDKAMRESGDSDFDKYCDEHVQAIETVLEHMEGRKIS